MAKMPKYMEIVLWAKEQIAGRVFLPGDRFHSEMELSDRFALSRHTVRHALDILENENYIRRVRGSGTYIAQSASSGKSRSMNIGVISTYLDDYIFPSIIRGIESVLTLRGYAMQCAFTYNKIKNETRALQHMLDKPIDGLIVEPTKSGLPSINLELYRDFERRGVPVVFFNARHEALPFPCVAMDDEDAGRCATRALVHAGHNRIAGIFLLDDRQGHLRYLGYLRALAEASLPLRDESVVWYSTEDFPGMWERPERILERIGDCSAVLCYNDQTAIRLLEALRRSGRRVPEDMAVVGVDNCDMAAMCDPPLTSVAHPLQELGVSAAETLVSLIDGGPAAADVLFPARLVERDSVRRGRETV